MYRFGKSLAAICVCCMLSGCVSINIDAQSMPAQSVTDAPAPTSEPEKTRVLNEGEYLMLPGGGQGQCAIYDAWGEIAAVITTPGEENMQNSVFHKGDLIESYRNGAVDIFSLESMSYVLSGCKDRVYCSSELGVYCVLSDQCELYDNKGTLIYAVPLAAAKNNEYYLSLTKCADNFMLCVTDGENAFSLSPRLIAMDGTATLLDTAFYDGTGGYMEMWDFGEYRITSSGGFTRLKDAWGRTVMESVSPVRNTVTGEISYIYNAEDMNVYDKNLKSVGTGTDNVYTCRGDVIDGFSYTYNGVTYTDAYMPTDSEDVYLYSIRDNNVYVYHDGSSYIIPAEGINYVLEINDSMLSYSVQSGESYFQRVVRLNDARQVFEDSEFSYNLHADCITGYVYNEQSGKGTGYVYDIDGNLLYSEESVYISYVRPGLLYITRGNYMGAATYDGKWLIKAVYGIYE